jgi:serine/threonine-protein kinase
VGPHKLAGRSGQLIAGRFELLETIGSGASSVVYRALDRMESDHVALKLSEWADAESAERMYREARIAGGLENTAAVGVRHLSATEDGAIALVMDLLFGNDLASVLHVREGRGQIAERSWTTAVLEPIARTLGAAHDQGIVHRDLKAENVFIRDPQIGGGVSLLDFGFAAEPGGSASYVAPEIWRYGSQAADARADIYSLGVLVFRMLAGRMPFEGSTVELSRAVLDHRRPSIHALRPDLPRELDAWVAQVLAVDPHHRFERMAAAWRALEECLEIYP